ncbi:MAG TPA: D-2-hydroxyacid dehydrogenase family protein [Burkholderiales bacterium]|nr:D-2-hydroxyacid dehydrogenase family protein [Burkholderiales bacterium]
MKVAILDDYQDAVRRLRAFRKLDGHAVTVINQHIREPAELARRIGDAEALVLIRERTPVGAELLGLLPGLRLISHNGAYPHIDVAACTGRGVAVAVGKATRPSYATAELTWGLIIAAMRQIPQQMARLKAGGWQSVVGVGLRARTLGVYGYGKIGNLVAGYGRAFGMKVLVWSRETALANARADGYNAAQSRQALFEESDVLSLHLRLVPETRGIVTAEDFARMKPSSVFVNTSRAGLVEEGALEKALRAGRPGCAAIDVFEDEPILDGNHPLLKMDNVIATPHLGYVEVDGLERYFASAFDQVLAFARGKPVNLLNPEVLQSC